MHYNSFLSLHDREGLSQIIVNVGYAPQSIHIMIETLTSFIRSQLELSSSEYMQPPDFKSWNLLRAERRVETDQQFY
eukprot:CAMPEP_0167765972 /NCGR_PEP_ID=MMETSP0110_2-20121227/15039_1 /TAXON_ID=629695 /ORGANISM="Gymnochlora sp., Strain CCMP2014" /LENGTH=76 /DNA_ID=CAMNT_0007653855 /DNA_START=1 /DNA_END=228 /DNA_ORIENTATION=+